VPRYILLVLVFRTTTWTVDRSLPIIGIMDASTYVLILITPVNVALNVYFVHYTDFGIYGSPIALSFTFSFAFFFLIIYTAYSPAHKQNGTWGGLQLRAVLDARSCIALLKLALPGILMVGTEWYVTPCCLNLSFTPVTSVIPIHAMFRFSGPPSKS
jgi:Na+-driven multidrug efflux pump